VVSCRELVSNTSRPTMAFTRLDLPEPSRPQALGGGTVMAGQCWQKGEASGCQGSSRRSRMAR
jgi:hypothetical protein